MTAKNGRGYIVGGCGAGGEQGERGEARELGAPADRHAVRRGDGDADAGEASRPDSHEDVRGSPPTQQFGDHRHELFGVAAADHFVGIAEACAGAVEQGDGAGGARRVKSEQHLGGNSGHKQPNAASP